MNILKNKTRMTISISSKAVLNHKKNLRKTERLKGKGNKRNMDGQTYRQS